MHKILKSRLFKLPIPHFLLGSSPDSYHPLPSLNFFEIFKPLQPLSPPPSTDLYENLLNLQSKPLENLSQFSEFYDKIIRMQDNNEDFPQLFTKDGFFQLKILIQTQISSKIEDFPLENKRRFLNFCSKLLRISSILSLENSEALIFLKNSLFMLKTSNYPFKIQEITEFLLLLQDFYRKSSKNLKENQDFCEILNILAISLQFLLKKPSKNANYGLFLLQILYCFVRFDYNNKGFFLELLPEVSKNFQIDQMLEIQLTSMILSFCKLNKKYPRIFTDSQRFFEQFEAKIQHRILENSLNFKRIPPIFYCFASLNKKPGNSKEFLIESLVENLEKFAREEIGSLIFSLSKLGIDEGFMIREALFRELKVKEGKNRFSDVELMNFLIAMRDFQGKGHLKRSSAVKYREFKGKTREISEPTVFKEEISEEKFKIKEGKIEEKSAILKKKQIKNDEFLMEFREEICDILAKRFKGNQMSEKTRLLFLYEIALKQRILKENQFSEYESFLFKELDLKSLDNFDFVTVGSILKEFRSEIPEDFLQKFKEMAGKREFVEKIEKDRIKNLLKYLKNQPTKYKPFLIKK